MTSNPTKRAFHMEALELIVKSTESALKRGYITCVNCDNFDRMSERCKLNNKRPPAPVIAFGCECFTWDSVPF